MGITVDESCAIDAPLETVWRVLTGVSAYSEWNPFIVSGRSDGDPTVVGTRLTFRIVRPDGKRSPSTERVTEVEGPHVDADGQASARWVYDYIGPMSGIGLIRAQRVQTLHQTPGQPTRYASHWEASGLLVPVAIRRDDIAAGMADQTAALKHVAEASEPGS